MSKFFDEANPSKGIKRFTVMRNDPRGMGQLSKNLWSTGQFAYDLSILKFRQNAPEFRDQTHEKQH